MLSSRRSHFRLRIPIGQRTMLLLAAPTSVPCVCSPARPESKLHHTLDAGSDGGVCGFCHFSPDCISSDCRHRLLHRGPGPKRTGSGLCSLLASWCSFCVIRLHSQLAIVDACVGKGKELDSTLMAHLTSPSLFHKLLAASASSTTELCARFDDLFAKLAVCGEAFNLQRTRLLTHWIATLFAECLSAPVVGGHLDPKSASVALFSHATKVALTTFSSMIDTVTSRGNMPNRCLDELQLSPVPSVLPLLHSCLCLLELSDSRLFLSILQQPGVSVAIVTIASCLSALQSRFQDSGGLQGLSAVGVRLTPVVVIKESAHPYKVPRLLAFPTSNFCHRFFCFLCLLLAEPRFALGNGGSAWCGRVLHRI